MAQDATCSLLLGNIRFANNPRYAAERKDLAHEPCSLIVCCSDARVPPEIVFDSLQLGTLFVVRTAGHVVQDNDPGMESIKYAIDHLHPHSIIVMGHEMCGAVTGIWDSYYGGADTCEELPTICKAIIPSLMADRGKSRAENITDSIQLNAILVARHIDSKLRVQSHPAYYSLTSGKVTWLCQHETARVEYDASEDGDTLVPARQWRWGLSADNAKLVMFALAVILVLILLSRHR